MAKRMAPSDFFMPDLKRSCGSAAAAADNEQARFATYNPRSLTITQYPLAAELVLKVPGMTAITNALALHIERALECPNVTGGMTKDVLWLKGGFETHITAHVAGFCNTLRRPITLVEYRVLKMEEETTHDFWHYVYALCIKAAPCVLVFDQVSGRAPPPAVNDILMCAHVAYFSKKEARELPPPLGMWTIFVDRVEPLHFRERIDLSCRAEYVVPSEQEQRDAVVSQVKERLLRVTDDGSAIERKLEQASSAVASVFRIQAESVSSLNASQLVSAPSTLQQTFRTSAGIRDFVDKCLTRSIDRKFQLARLCAPTSSALELSLFPDEEDFTALATRIADRDNAHTLLESRAAADASMEFTRAEDLAMLGGLNKF